MDHTYRNLRPAAELGGGLFLGGRKFNQSDNNGTILTISHINTNVMESASE